MSVAVPVGDGPRGRASGLRRRLGQTLLKSLLRHAVGVGALEIRFDAGAPIHGGEAGVRPEVAIRLHGSRAPLLLALDPEFQLGELYASGELTIERGSLDALMGLVGRNIAGVAHLTGLSAALNRIVAFIDEGNSTLLARRNAQFHYDLPESMYRAFLDADMQYSCAYFADRTWDLDTAQHAKKLHIASKLCLKPGQRVLDIGCGWGGMALTLARTADVEVTGITLSPEQLQVARRRAENEGLADRVRFELLDYREVNERFDRIVSVGMLEHVGKQHFPAFFDTVERLLTDDGVALIHSIGRRRAYGGSDRWIRKRIFPGGYIPSLSELAGTIERTGLWTTDVEILRLHYAETLKRWRRRFVDRCQQLFVDDPRFFRTWEFYLASCEMAFRHTGLMVMQLQLARDIAAAPVTRDYMFREEEQLKQESSPSATNAVEQVSS
jgi:cyclopropane-fatty-acyl-phospholipid synthase